MNRINKLILFYKNLSIKDKITLANVVVIGIIALFIFFFFPARIKREGIKNLEDKAYSISQILAINSIAALEFSDTLSLNENVSSIRNDKDVAYVVVLDQSKNPISNYTLHNEDIISFLIDAGIKKNIVHVKFPIMHNGTQIGSLALGLSTERINKEVRNARFLSLFIAIAIIFFGIIINRALSYGITIPITQIVKSIDKLGTDDWKDIKVTSEDEIGQMAKAFNRFAEEFKKEQELLVRKEELEKAQEELKRAMEIKSEFTSMVSHELRTPLTAIKESIGIVLDGTAGELNDEQKDFLSTAKRNVDRLHRLINDVLDFSKLESGKIKYDMKPYNINEVIKEAMKTHMSVAEQKNLYLVSNLDPDIPIMVFDDDRITQVITNFLSNALKFTEKGGITVTTDYNKEEKMVYICVKDTGPGIKKEDIPKLFKQFSQLGGPDGRKTGGTGLGLAICKKIIEDHRGKTWVESEVGKGSSFYFKLPVS